MTTDAPQVPGGSVRDRTERWGAHGLSLTSGPFANGRPASTETDVAKHSDYLAGLSGDDRSALQSRLHERQGGNCFICDRVIDLTLHQTHVDHVVPLSEDGADDEHNFALTHSSCNQTKGASSLRLARCMAEFETLQQQALEAGERGANLGHLLAKYGGGNAPLQLEESAHTIRFVLSIAGDETIHRVPLYRDPLSDSSYFFALLPLEYIHHDDRINPRSIGSNLRRLIEEFLRRRPQLHVGLAWWSPGEDGTGKVKMFDGQHKAASQILIGARKLPVRVFVRPDLNVLLQTNTNAGDKLRQVAFDTAVLRHLGSTLYAERVQQYQQSKGLQDDDYSFSEKDLVAFFRGERREVQKYIVDWVRDSVNYHPDNRLKEYVEWAGRKGDRPLAYSTVEKTFFAEFLYKYALDKPIALGMDRGDNPRILEQEQLVRMMNLYADIFCVAKWDPDLGGRRLEARVRAGKEVIGEAHLRAWRATREEVLSTILKHVRLVIEHYYAFTGQMIAKDRLMQDRLPEAVWDRISSFLERLAGLPAWVDKHLSNTVFGAKQNRDFWMTVFSTGKSPDGLQVFTKPIDVIEMMQGTGRVGKQ